jgi:hypothetical protein
MAQRPQHPKLPKYNTENYRRACELKRSGMSYKEVAEAMGISPQRAQQLNKPPVQVYNLVKKRADGKCEKCGKPVFRGNVHHIKYGEHPWDLECLLYVCVPCHSMIHAYGDGYDPSKIHECGVSLDLNPHVVPISDSPRVDVASEVKGEVLAKTIDWKSMVLATWALSDEDQYTGILPDGLSTQQFWAKIGRAAKRLGGKIGIATSRRQWWLWTVKRPK